MTLLWALFLVWPAMIGIDRSIDKYKVLRDKFMNKRWEG